MRHVQISIAMMNLALIEFNQTLLYKFIRFGVVGFSGLAIDFGITYVCKEKLKIHKYVSSSLGFTVATASNYTLNRNWTFEDHAAASITQFSKFFMIALVGLFLSNILIYLLHDKLKWNFYVAKACAIVVISLWNFFANYLYTFSS